MDEPDTPSCHSSGLPGKKDSRVVGLQKINEDPVGVCGVCVSAFGPAFKARTRVNFLHSK